MPFSNAHARFSLQKSKIKLLSSGTVQSTCAFKLCVARDGESGGAKTISTTGYSSLHHSGLQQDVEPQDHSLPASGEIALFRAVIMQALLDSVSQSKRTEDKIARRQALEWFSDQDPDFIAVCQLAQLNYRWVLEQSTAAIAKGCRRSPFRNSVALSTKRKADGNIGMKS